LVLAIVEAGGDAMLAVPGRANQLPLHRAAWKSPFPAVVMLFLARGPAGAALAEIGAGRTLLYLAQKLNDGPGAAEIRALLRVATDKTLREAAAAAAAVRAAPPGPAPSAPGRKWGQLRAALPEDGEL
jgi:hypothetical protein